MKPLDHRHNQTSYRVLDHPDHMTRKWIHLKDALKELNLKDKFPVPHLIINHFCWVCCCILHVLHLSGQKENNQTETRTVLCMKPDFAETKQRIKPDHLRKQIQIVSVSVQLGGKVDTLTIPTELHLINTSTDPRQAEHAVFFQRDHSFKLL